jgi:signal transduction histidine kinase
MKPQAPQKYPILIVDDEPSVLNSLERSLRRQYEVITATSGEDALRILRERDIPIIITDQRMPGMTGVELLARVREQSPLSIGIILTGYADGQAAIDAINIGQAYRFHVKPWNNDDLERSLQTALARYDRAIARTEQLERLNRELEQEVTARTVELRAQNILITELERLKSRFTVNVSHELRTPLAVLKSYLDLLRYGRLEKREHYLQNAIRAEEQLEALIIAILDFSKMNLVADQLDFQPVELNRLVGSAVAAREALAHENTIRLSCVLIPQEVIVSADERLLRQAFDNVLLNALKYTPTGGEVRVWFERLGVAEDSQAGTEVAIHVNDTGPGILPEDRPYLFEPFLRGTEHDSGHIAGLGLGLPLTAKILQWHRGRIAVDSTPGRGSTFSLRLPVAQVAADV